MAGLPEGLSVALLDGLGEEDSARFFELASLVTFEDDERVITEGESGEALYVVRNGLVRVEKGTIDQDQELLSTLGPGECFGELSLIDRHPRSASVTATGSAELYKFRQDDLDLLFRTHSHIHLRVLENLVKITSQRLRNLDEAIVESVYNTVILLDPEFRVVRWRQVTGTRSLLEAEAIPDGRDLFGLVPRLGEGVRRKLETVRGSGEVATIALEYEGPDDRPVYFELTAAPYSGRETRNGLILALRDVTESRSLEAQLIQADKLAMAGQMSSEIGHELNNYLAVIVGHTDLLEMDESIRENPRAAKSLGAISGQLRKIEKFVSGLMDLSVLRTKREAADLNLLIENLVQFIQGQSRFQQVHFEMDLDREVPLVEVDPGQVQQVILNLYANAADAMKKGLIKTRSSYDAKAATVTLEVEDSGPGMPEDVLNKIFESGFTTKDTGHGFGLAICNRIIRNHNGDIEVDSIPGEGTTFKLTFPA